MKYRTLPLYTELDRIRVDEGDDRVAQVLGTYTTELMRTRGFQILVQILRDLEALALKKMRRGKGTDQDAGCLVTIESIRESLLACLPEAEREAVDYYDDEQEGFLIDDSPNSSGSPE